jgi:GAF domain-containing protein
LAKDSPDLAADVELALSELVTNAVLHGEPPITVRVLLDGGVRLEVRDAGRLRPILLSQSPEAMTGRGLSMVAAVATTWGVEPVAAGGKVTWAQVDAIRGSQMTAAAPAVDVDALIDAWADDDPGSATYAVRLGAVTTDLLLSAKAHVDNVVRELMLMREGEVSSGVPLAPELAVLIRTVTMDFADARSEIKRQVAAAARGDLLTDLELHLSPAAADAGERYLVALDEADRYARSAHLLTLAAPPVHRIFRRWYVQSLVDQLRLLSRGESPPPPQPFQAVLTEEVTNLAEQAAATTRLQLLQKVTAELADAHSTKEMGRIVTHNAVDYLGAKSARVRLLTSYGTLRTVAGAGAETGEGAPYAEYPVDGDLPGAEALRTRRRVYIRSLKETFDRVPDLDGVYRAGRSAHAIPLVVGDQALGVLSLTFLSGELINEPEVAVLEALADALAQAIKRAELAISDMATRESLRFLAEATEILVSSREPTEVMERLVDLAVPRLGDWCTVYMVDGSALRREAMAVAGHPELVEQLKATSLSLDADTPQTRTFRSGQPEWMDREVDHLLADLYPEADPGVLGSPHRRSGLSVPIELRGERIGVIALSFFDGRPVTPTMVETLTGLGARAAIAYDNVGRWSAQRDVVGALVRALLPEQPPSVPGVTFAARYLPASGDIAGDWWEAQPLGDGTVLVGVGDAAGHGLPAVSQMSQLRQGARAVAMVEGRPASLLGALNRLLDTADSGFAAALYGRLDPASGLLLWASAGHLPPLHIAANGQVAVIDQEPGPPLGSPVPATVVEQHLTLAAGEILLLYTDGVVERRNQPLDEGIRRLARTVAGRATEPLEALADRIMAVHCSEPLDDCSILLPRRTGR